MDTMVKTPKKLILFVDFDGVLNNTEYKCSENLKRKTSAVYYDRYSSYLNPENVNIFKLLLEELKEKGYEISLYIASDAGASEEFSKKAIEGSGMDWGDWNLINNINKTEGIAAIYQQNPDAEFLILDDRPVFLRGIDKDYIFAPNAKLGLTKENITEILEQLQKNAEKNDEKGTGMVRELFASLGIATLSNYQSERQNYDPENRNNYGGERAKSKLKKNPRCAVFGEGNGKAVYYTERV